MEESWTRLKLAVTAPGLTYSEVLALDIFEFFTLLREAQRRNRPEQ